MKSRYKTKTKQKSFQRPVKILVAIVVVGLVAAGAYLKFHNTTKLTATTNVPGAGTTASSTKGINLNPPTAQDQTLNNQDKDNLVTQSQSTPPQTSNDKIAVTPFITTANSSTVNAYVPGVFENGGTCTATLTKGSETITRTSTGFENASYTQCPPMSLAGVNLDSGTWTVVVSYASTTAQGSSQPSTFTK